jgi:Ni,Fe-hydrogenase III large subunit/Ni,Fe-hydrogenase III component G
MTTAEEAVSLLKNKLGSKVIEFETPKPRRAYVLMKSGYHRDAISLLLEKFDETGVSTITGTDLGSEIELNYHIRCRGPVITIKNRVPKEKPEIMTITDLMPGAALYEREVFDLLGVVFQGHPDLKRLVLSDDWPEGSYPLRKDWDPQILEESVHNPNERSSIVNGGEIEGATSSVVTVVMGPQHPALHEPERFSFKIDGEVVVDVEPRLGYVHRGIEKAAERLMFFQDVYLVERICGICNAAHTVCFSQAVESIGNTETPSRARYLRTIVHELNRIHSHLLLLGVAGLELGYEPLFQYVWRDREPVLDTIEVITGNRILTAFNTIGGVRRDLKPGIPEKIKRTMNRLKKKMKFYKNVFEEDPTVRLRTKEVGILKPSSAKKLCVVGPVARGSGISMDIRRDDAYAAYDEIPFNVVTYKDCDSWARLMVRVEEIVESIDIINYALDHIPGGPYRVKVPRRQPEGEAVSRVEAPRGELIHYVKSDGSAYPYRVKVRSPTLANIISFREIIRGSYVADIPAALISLDPCFSCTDRMTFVDVNNGRKWHWNLSDIKRLKKRS